MEPTEGRYRDGDVEIVFSDYAHDSSSKRTFVLIHGIGMGRIVFDGVAQVLGEHGRVIVPDLPGFGDSPEPGTKTSIEQTAENITRFVRREVNGPVTLIGHSMGTQIVAEMAVRHASLVDALVLIAPTINRHERTARQQIMRMFQDLARESPKVLLLGTWEYLKTNPVWFISKLRFMLRHHLEEICPEITLPTLVLRGENDPVCPRQWVTEVAQLIPNAKMLEIEDRGHEAVIKSPEPAASMILDFV